MIYFVALLLQWTGKVSYLMTIITFIFGVVLLLIVFSFPLKPIWRSILLVTILIEVWLSYSYGMGG